MKSAIASQLVRQKTRRSARRPLPANVWQWPSADASLDLNPDTRLLCPELPDMTARLYFADESVIVAEVRALTAHDVVLRLPEHHVSCVQGQIVTVTVSHDSEILIDAEKSILHWAGRINQRNIAALFTLHATESSIVERFDTDARGGVRYPIDLPVTMRTKNGRTVAAQLADYSLNGCRLVCEESLALDCEYETQIRLGQSIVEVAVRPRWARKSVTGYQMGCTFRSDEGVLFACRYQEQLQQTRGLKGPFGRFA